MTVTSSSHVKSFGLDRSRAIALSRLLTFKAYAGTHSGCN
jgi:hypothetical protein